jgi:eukaryotic-like serine/threonine-protein kinase
MDSSRPSDRPDPPSFGNFGNCRVLSLLEEGPLTRSYRAEQEPSGRIVAVTALRETIVPTSSPASELEREARLLARFAHPNVRGLFDFVKTDEAMWMVLEDIEGVTLDQLLASGHALSPSAAVTIAEDLAAALTHVHGHHVVHRDLRPHAIHITNEGAVKLGGFHAARANQPFLGGDGLPLRSLSGETAGDFSSPAYMSPEQVLGDTVDARADLFALGVILYEMLAGVRPFDGPDAREVSQRIRHEAPPPLPTSNRGITDPLARIVEKCLEKVPDHRFASAAELSRELARVRDASRIVVGPRTVTAELLRAGLIETLPVTQEEGADTRAHPTTGRSSLGRTAAGLSVLLGCMLAGGAVIQSRSPSRTFGAGPSDGLALAPDHPAELRVVVRPWASVYVDGYFVDVTPFARPIPLPAGTHPVVFRHPNAPEEHRTVKIAENDRAFVEVEMKVPDAPPPPRPAPETIPSASASASRGPLSRPREAQTALSPHCRPPTASRPLPLVDPCGFVRGFVRRFVRRDGSVGGHRIDRRLLRPRLFDGHRAEHAAAELVQQDVGGLVQIDHVAPLHAAALPPDRFEEELRIFRQFGQLVASLQPIGVALREHFGGVEGHDDVVDRAVGDGAPESEQQRRVVGAEVGPEDAGVVPEDDARRQDHLLLRLRDRGLVAHVRDFAPQQGVDQRGFSDVRDADDERTDRPLGRGQHPPGRQRLAAVGDLFPGIPRSIGAERDRPRARPPVGELLVVLERAQPALGHHRIGQITFREQLQARLLPTELLQHGILAGARHAGVEHFDDEVLARHRVGDFAPRFGHVARVPLDGHGASGVPRPAEGAGVAELEADADARGAGTKSSTGGQKMRFFSPVARSTQTAYVARSSAGSSTWTRTLACRAKSGGALGERGGEGASSRGRSKRTRSRSSRPTYNSSANRPIVRGVATGLVWVTRRGRPTETVPSVT